MKQFINCKCFKPYVIYNKNKCKKYRDIVFDVVKVPSIKSLNKKKSLVKSKTSTRKSKTSIRKSKTSTKKSKISTRKSKTSTIKSKTSTRKSKVLPRRKNLYSKTSKIYSNLFNNNLFKKTHKLLSVFRE